MSKSSKNNMKNWLHMHLPKVTKIALGSLGVNENVLSRKNSTFRQNNSNFIIVLNTASVKSGLAMSTLLFHIFIN
jgi:hypothetical protein